MKYIIDIDLDNPIGTFGNQTQYADLTTGTTWVLSDRVKDKLIPLEQSEDCISRSDAIDAVIEWYGCEPSDMDYFVKILAKKPSAEPAQQWTPCSEGTPEKEGWYFVTVHPDYIVPYSRHTDSLYWFDGKWWFFDYDARMAVWTDPIIAWMPLPEPYKGEKE